jgi:predicted dinucleotide-binding enzyme
LLSEGEHTTFVCGNTADAKAQVTVLLKSFGWTDIIDLGNITAARGTEHYLPLWLRLFGAIQTPMFNIKVIRVNK